MTKRKRKSPERKPARRAPGFASRAAGALAGFAARHPVGVGGAAAFCVVFGMIAANALWYQPGVHPSPFWRTRDRADFNALAGLTRNPLMEDPARVTTFRIERAEEPQEGDAAAPAEAATSAPAVNETTAAVPPVDAAADTGLVRSVQEALARRGFYDGTVDGVTGPRTEAAIAAFQKSVAMPADGRPSPELLAALTVESGAVAVRPAQRPAGDISPAAGEDPVAAAIRSAERTVTTVSEKRRKAQTEERAVEAVLRPAKDIPQAIAGGADPNLVMAIQQGLSNIAYSDVKVDGVAGEETRAAIRHFERHYRLPETGEPNPAVLKKLKDIGAL
ncbi:peptidoglycan-binding domain-containing protein [Ciceribacter ferrooxidans]|uniref:Peptidoglycan-binding protein n=1 Tax=Ciceribacter ferrooxidans TaxID=2509717 RepID=A0A4Q2TWF9_9HYPH|nr:peptidoglycan-binding domain-containing protein [Ciceribacter ferrooxidans]RYC26827.1 peptidoglycan-binding protein [Ciceribacter ferrooxidans]